MDLRGEEVEKPTRARGGGETPLTTVRENILRNNRRDSKSLGFSFLSPFPRPGLPSVGGVWIGIVVTICQTRLLDAASRRANALDFTGDSYGDSG